MSPNISKLLEIIGDRSREPWETMAEAENAKADLQRLVEWTRKAGHLPTCHYMAKMDMDMDYELIHPCDCGRDEIQSLLGE